MSQTAPDTVRVPKMGYVPDAAHHVATWKPVSLDVAPAATADLRPILRTLSTPVLTQSFSDCVPNAVGLGCQGTLAQKGIASDLPSRTATYWEGRCIDMLESSDGGSQPSAVLEGINRMGVVSESDCPYPGDPLKPLPTHAYADGFDTAHQLAYSIATTADDLRRGGAQSLFGLCALGIDQAFVDWRPGMAPWTLTGAIIGYHYLLFVGCTPDALILQSSWGTDFGDGGSILVADAAINDPNCTDKYVITAAPKAEVLCVPYSTGSSSASRSPRRRARTPRHRRPAARATTSARSGATSRSRLARARRAKRGCPQTRAPSGKRGASTWRVSRARRRARVRMGVGGDHRSPPLHRRRLRRGVLPGLCGRHHLGALEMNLTNILQILTIAILAVVALLFYTNRKGTPMNTIDLSGMQALVAKDTTVKGSAKTLISSLVTQIQQAGQGPDLSTVQAQINDLVSKLSASDDDLAAAVSANTPASPAGSTPAAPATPPVVPAS